MAVLLFISLYIALDSGRMPIYNIGLTLASPWCRVVAFQGSVTSRNVNRAVLSPNGVTEQTGCAHPRVTTLFWGVVLRFASPPRDF
jgi:hypothetical protein